MDRRELLIGLLALTATQVACQRNTAGAFRIAALKGILPPQVLTPFKQSLPDNTSFKLTAITDRARLFHQLQAWQPQGEGNGADGNAADLLSRADWVSLSDYWLTAAIAQNLISPIPTTSLPDWQDIPAIWRSLLQRNGQGLLSETGPTWATPYRWGHLMMVYSRRQFQRLGWEPTQWQDLWRPELARHIILPNHPRLVLGMVLKSLGYSANSLDPTQYPQVLAALDALPAQVKTYTSDTYLQPLIVGDAWLAVGWSTEIRPVITRYQQLAAITPDPGTLLFADVWVRPLGAGRESEPALSTLDEAWLSYWWQPEVLAPLSLFSQGLSPLLLAPEALEQQAADLSQEALFIPTADQLANSEFITPLPEAAIDRYQTLWQALRGGK
jgi:putative spermidine/putrescine transport system substrate-binding protein